MRGQEATNWCWAAVTQSVDGALGNGELSQKDVAVAHLLQSHRAHDCGSTHRTKPLGKCRDATCSAACNSQHVLRIVLGERGRYAGYLTEKRAPRFDELQAEINLGRPVPCRVALGSGGHFVLVTGWSVDGDGKELVHVLDPLRAGRGQPIPELVLGHAEFASRYRVSSLRGPINYSYKVQ